MSKMVKFLIAAVVVGAIVFSARSLMIKRKAEIAQTPLPAHSYTSVMVVQPKEGSLEKRVSFLAQIDSDKSIKLSTKIPGYIEKVYVKEAQTVKKGTLLVKIDESELLASLASLKATLSMQEADAKVAQSIYERNQKLYDIGGISLEKLQLSKVALEAKQAQVEGTKQKIAQLNNQREYLRIKAPFDGVVDKILLHTGDLAVTGKPIVSMSNHKQKLLFSFATTDIQKAQSVYYDQKKVGAIRSIYPTSTNGLSIAEVALDTTINKPLLSQINIEVAVAKKEGCVVPSDVLLHKKDGDYVMVQKEERFYPQKVEVLLVREEQAVLSSCPNHPVARGNETKLSQLPAFTHITIIGH